MGPGLLISLASGQQPATGPPIAAPGLAPAWHAAAAAPRAGGRLAAHRVASGAPGLPLYQARASVACLDADAAFMGALCAQLLCALPGVRVRHFMNAADGLAALRPEKARWEAALRAQQAIVAAWHRGQPLLEPLLNDMAFGRPRHVSTTVLVLDQDLPELTGLEVLADLSGWPGWRVLTSASDNPRLALAGFNADLITRFARKRSADAVHTLARLVEVLLATPQPRQQQLWQATLAPAQAALLGREDIAQELGGYLRERFVEWVVVGDPFGVLAFDVMGDPYWLQLAPRGDLQALAALWRDTGDGTVDPAAVARGEQLPNLAMRRALGLPGCDLVPACAVGADGALRAALTRLQLHAAPVPRGRFCRAAANGDW